MFYSEKIRRCRICGHILSQYNPNMECFRHPVYIPKEKNDDSRVYGKKKFSRDELILKLRKMAKKINVEAK